MYTVFLKIYMYDFIHPQEFTEGTGVSHNIIICSLYLLVPQQSVNVVSGYTITPLMIFIMCSDVAFKLLT